MFPHKISLVHKLHGQREKMKFFSTHVFWTRPIFIWMGLWINFHNKSSHRAKVTIWVAMSNHCLIGPIFFNEIANCEQYLHMLQNNVLLQCMAQGLHLLTLWLMQDGAWPHTVNNVLDLFNTVLVPTITSNCYLDHHNCDIFGHLPDLIWITVTSFCAVSWKRRCCHENHPMKLRWKLCLLSCAQGLMKTHHGVITNLCVNFKNVRKEMVATWE